MKVLKEIREEYVLTCYDPSLLSQLDRRGVVRPSAWKKIHRRQKMASAWKI